MTAAYTAGSPAARLTATISAARTACQGQPARAEHREPGESPGGLHPPALAEPGVSLSAHRAPIVQPSGRRPSRQCANRSGSRRATFASNCHARAGWRRSRLYFHIAHRTR